MLRSLFRKIRQEIIDHGALTYLLYALDRGLKKIVPQWGVEYFHIFAMPVAARRRLKIPASFKGGYTFQVLDHPEPILSAFKVPPETLEFRFAQNTLCFVLKRGESPVAKLWLARERYAEDVVLCDIALPWNTAWDFDLVVLPEYQLTLCFAILWEQAFQWLAKENIAWVLSRIAVLNRRSREVHRRLGGEVIGNCIFIKLRNIEICFDGINHTISLHHGLRRKQLNAGRLVEKISLMEKASYED